MSRNTRIEVGVTANDGAFSQGLKMPMLPTTTPGLRPGDFGLNGNKVYVRLQDQTVIALGTDTNGPWSSVLAVGNTSGAFNPTITAGQGLLYSSGIRIGSNLGLPSAGSGCVAIGNGGTQATGISCTALGPAALATSNNCTALGVAAEATFVNSTALGFFAVTTAANQVMIGNNANGLTTEVRLGVGVDGLTYSEGYVRAGKIIDALKTADGTQIASSGTDSAIDLKGPTTFSDYGSPTIVSVNDVLTVRPGSTISGVAMADLSFAALGAYASFIVSVVKDPLGAATDVIASHTFNLPALSTTAQVTLPFLLSLDISDPVTYVGMHIYLDTFPENVTISNKSFVRGIYEN